jgi:hypothetical protein
VVFFFSKSEEYNVKLHLNTFQTLPWTLKNNQAFDWGAEHWTNAREVIGMSWGNKRTKG